MLINRFLTLGCSITDHPGWASYTSQCINRPLLNVAVSSGSNDIQQHYVQHAILTNQIQETDLVIWQVTSTIRKYARMPATVPNRLAVHNLSHVTPNVPYLITPFENLFDHVNRIEALSHVAEPLTPLLMLPEADRISALLFDMVALSRFTKNMVVLLGWEHAISPEYKQQFETVLRNHNIRYIPTPIVDWCITQQLTFNGDNIHPSNHASCSYAQQVILPVLDDMLHTTITRLPLPPLI
jgi:hypothetical protein